MSLVAAIARIEELQSAFAPRDITPVQTNASGGASVPSAVTASASSANAFSNLLNGALGGNTNPALTMPISSPAAAVNGANPIYAAGGVPVNGGVQKMIALAQGEVGQAEYPPGSNDSPRISTYREATAGSGVGPWCAYFVSWLGQQSGTPLGESGQGFGRVDDVYAWAQSTGRAVPNGPGVVPNPGDLIVWDEHIGMVEQVLPDGRVQTIEGNSSDKVSRNVHEAGSALGYVRMS